MVVFMWHVTTAHHSYAYSVDKEVKQKEQRKKEKKKMLEARESHYL